MTEVLKKGTSLKIGWFYPEYLNLYGDRGNVEILYQRASRREISVEVIKIGLDTKLNSDLMRELNLVFMGGGPDLSQQKIYKDFLENKASFLVPYLEFGGVGLFICGSYQLLGTHYKDAEGKVMKGLSFLDFFTEVPSSAQGKRSIGNVVVEINPDLLDQLEFKNQNFIGSTLVGFENHGGLTYLSEELKPLGSTSVKFGNNKNDRSEGLWYKNTIGTYLHGPVLARNPHLADFLIAKSIGLDQLSQLDDSVIISAHAQSKELDR